MEKLKYLNGILNIVLGVLLIISALSMQSVEIQRDSALEEVEWIKADRDSIKEDNKLLEDKLREKDEIIASKDMLLIQAGYQPYELEPCYKCGSSVTIELNSGTGNYYIDCTKCELFAGFFFNVADAEEYWNNKEDK